MARTRSLASRSSRRDDAVLVIGLGRFGSALAIELEALGHEVLGIDTSASRTQELSQFLTHVVAADTTAPDVLRQLGAGEFRLAVVAIGTDIEASILTTAALVDLEVPTIWAKAVTESHRRILLRVGAHHVVQPEHDMGRRSAHLVTGRILEYLALDEDFALVESPPPAALVGRTLAQAKVRERYGVTVVCVKPEGQSFTFATPDTVVGPGDILVVAGEPKKAEAFAGMT